MLSYTAPMKVKYIKEQYLRALISDIEDDSIVKYVFYKIGLIYNSEFYSTYRLSDSNCH